MHTGMLCQVRSWATLWLTSSLLWKKPGDKTMVIDRLIEYHFVYFISADEGIRQVVPCNCALSPCIILRA